MFCLIFLLGHKVLVTELMARLCTSYPVTQYAPQIENQTRIVGIIFLKPSDHADLLPHPLTPFVHDGMNFI
jgi:hypothetical protein